MHSNGVWKAFPGVPGGMQRSQPRLACQEAVGWAVVSPGVGWEQAFILKPALQAERISDILRGLCAKLAPVL